MQFVTTAFTGLVQNEPVALARAAEPPKLRYCVKYFDSETSEL